MRDFSWDDAKVFAAVAEAGSWRRAAATLGLSTATASRRVEAFEAWVGEELIERRPDGPRLTARGLRMMEALRGMREAADTIRRGTAERQAEQVRITATSSMGLVLLAHLGELMAAAPGAVISLLPTRATLSLARREAEIAIRMGTMPEEGRLLVRRLATVRVALYAAPGLVEAAGRDLAALPYLGFAPDPKRAAAEAAIRGMVGEGPPAAVLDDTQMRFAACRAGLGVALLPCKPADAAGLVRLASMPEETDEVAWMLMHEDVAAKPSVRAVADGVAALFARSRAALRGEG
jgi:DNA-binding transcriptional LysR family regulator